MFGTASEALMEGVAGAVREPFLLEALDVLAKDLEERRYFLPQTSFTSQSRSSPFSVSARGLPVFRS